MSTVFPEVPALPVVDELLEHPAAARAMIAPVMSTGTSPGASLLPFTMRVLSFGCPIRCRPVECGGCAQGNENRLVPMTRELPRFSAKTAAFHQLFWVSEQLASIG
jgi:hypothetical protein